MLLPTRLPGRVGVHDREFERHLPSRESRNQTPIIKIGRRWADPTNQTNVHVFETSIVGDQPAASLRPILTVDHESRRGFVATRA
jgi:hypothetical protein